MLTSKETKLPSSRVYNKCKLCKEECDKDRSNTSLETWDVIKNHVYKWTGLDRPGSAYTRVDWESDPQGKLYHEKRKAISSIHQLQQAWNCLAKHQSFVKEKSEQAEVLRS